MDTRLLLSSGRVPVHFKTALHLPLKLSWFLVVQKSAAKPLTQSTTTDHVTPILASFHWLPAGSTTYRTILSLTSKACSRIQSIIQPVIPGKMSSIHSFLQAWLTAKDGGASAVKAPKIHRRKWGQKKQWPLLNLFFNSFLLAEGFPSFCLILLLTLTNLYLLVLLLPSLWCEAFYKQKSVIFLKPQSNFERHEYSSW